MEALKGSAWASHRFACCRTATRSSLRCVAAWLSRREFLPVLIVAIALSGCGDPPPVQTTLAALKASQADFSGRQVVVSGTLRTFDSPRHYWIENEALDRVALEGADELAPLVGQTVEVSGTFVYDRNAGRRIVVQQLRTVP